MPRPGYADTGVCRHGPDPQRPDDHAASAPGEQTADLEMFKLACEHFRQDIAAHWSQAAIFAVIQGAFISLLRRRGRAAGEGD